MMTKKSKISLFHIKWYEKKKTNICLIHNLLLHTQNVEKLNFYCFINKITVHESFNKLFITDSCILKQILLCFI